MKPNYAVRVREHILDMKFTEDVFYYESLDAALITYDRALKDGSSVSLWARIERPDQEKR